MQTRQQSHLYTPGRGHVRPRDSLGPPTDPMNFGKPQFELAYRRDRVLAYIPDEQEFESFDNVLMRVHDDADVGNLAYAPISTKATNESRTGHVEYCNVLQRRRPENNNKNSDDFVFELTSRVVAVKVCFQHKMDQIRAARGMEDTFKEVAVMQELGDLPHVSTCQVALYVPDKENPGNSSYNVVMPYYKDGDVYDLLKNMNEYGSNRIHEAKARLIFRDIIQGLKALHDSGVCHHDISIENIMLNDDRAYIIDLGMALKVPYRRDEKSQTLQRCLVTPQGAYGKTPYMAPEVYASARPRTAVPFDSEAIDVWSSGCVLFCMLTGSNSYHVPLMRDATFLYMAYHMQDLMDQWDIEVSDECLHLLQMMLQVNPRLRYGIDEILSHPWLQPNG